MNSFAKLYVSHKIIYKQVAYVSNYSQYYLYL